MFKRNQLETLLRKISDKDFEEVWKETYGYLPTGARADLVRDFVAEQYDTELDDRIRYAEALLGSTVEQPKPNKWLAPH